MYHDVEEVELTLEDCFVTCKNCDNTIKHKVIVASYGDFCSYSCLEEYKTDMFEYYYYV